MERIRQQVALAVRDELSIESSGKTQSSFREYNRMLAELPMPKLCPKFKKVLKSFKVLIGDYHVLGDLLTLLWTE